MSTFLDPYFSVRDRGERAFSVENAAIRFGSGVLAEVGAEARALGLSRVALIVDPRARQLPPFEIAHVALTGAGVDVVVYDRVTIEPTEPSVLAAAAFARDAAVDGFVSLGGGSTIDTAKVANLLSSFPAPILDYVYAPAGLAQPVPGPHTPRTSRWCPTALPSEPTCRRRYASRAPSSRSGSPTTRPARSASET